MSDRRGLTAAWLVGAGCFVAWALWRGEDANWDLQNYHDYAAYALLHWRYGLDVGAGAFQGYFNPLPYLLPYALRHTLPPVLAAILLALVQSALAPLVWLLSGYLLPERNRMRPWLRGLATACGLCSAMALSEIGTSFADLLLCIPSLGSLLCLLASADRASPRQQDRLLLLAGMLVGVAAGLKPTEATSALGLAAASLLPIGRGMARRLVLLGFGGLAGVLVAGGPWAAVMAIRYDNPLFPAYNDVFHSASAIAGSFAETYFLPHGLRDALGYPWRIALGGHPTAENQFADPRFLALLLIAALFLLVRRPAPSASALSRTALFLTVATLVWLEMFAVERYAMLYEIVAGVLLVALMAGSVPRHLSLSVGTVLTVAMIGLTRPPDWWHRRWSDPFVPILPAMLHEPADYLLLVHPMGYWASRLPQGSRSYSALSDSIGIGGGGVLAAQRAAGLAHPPSGGVRTLDYDRPMGDAARRGLSELGFIPSAPCVRMPSLWSIDSIVCHAVQVGPRAEAAADLSSAASFRATGSGWIYLGDGWGSATADGTPMTSAAATLILHLSASSIPRAIELGFAAPWSGRVSLTGGPAGAVSGTADRRTLCIGPRQDPSGAVVSVTLSGSPAVLARIGLRAARPGECVATGH